MKKVFLGIKRLKYLQSKEGYLETVGTTQNTKDVEILIDEDGCVIDSLSEDIQKLAELNKERERLLNSIVYDLNICYGDNLKQKKGE